MNGLVGVVRNHPPGRYQHGGIAVVQLVGHLSLPGQAAVAFMVGQQVGGISGIDQIRAGDNRLGIPIPRQFGSLPEQFAGCRIYQADRMGVRVGIVEHTGNLGSGIRP